MGWVVIIHLFISGKNYPPFNCQLKPSAIGNVYLLKSLALSYFIWSLKKSRHIEFFSKKWPWVFLEVEFFGPWVFWKCPKNKPEINLIFIVQNYKQRPRNTFEFIVPPSFSNIEKKSSLKREKMKTGRQLHFKLTV